MVNEPGFGGSLAENNAKGGTVEVWQRRIREGTKKATLCNQFGIVGSDNFQVLKSRLEIQARLSP